MSVIMVARVGCGGCWCIWGYCEPPCTGQGLPWSQPGEENTLTTVFPFPSPAASLSAGIYGGAEEQL